MSASVARDTPRSTVPTKRAGQLPLLELLSEVHSDDGREADNEPRIIPVRDLPSLTCRAISEA